MELIEKPTEKNEDLIKRDGGKRTDNLQAESSIQRITDVPDKKFQEDIDSMEDEDEAIRKQTRKPLSSRSSSLNGMLNTKPERKIEQSQFVVKSDKTQAKNNMDDGLISTLASKNTSDNDDNLVLTRGENIPYMQEIIEGQDIATQHQDITPQDQDIEPKDQDSMPEDQDITPQDQDIAPIDQDSMSEDQDVAPQDQAIEPQDQDVEAQENENVNKEGTTIIQTDVQEQENKLLSQGQNIERSRSKDIEMYHLEKEIARAKRFVQSNIGLDIANTNSDRCTVFSEQPTLRKYGQVKKLDPITSHIRMEEIQWQRLLERKLNRETNERELEQRYKDEIRAQIRNIEKQKKIDNITLKRRMSEFEKKRRSNNYIFHRMQQKKDRDYQIENEALQHRILEIEKQKQRNINKLKERVNYLEDRKQKEQDLFLQRMQELEKRREEEYEASQKRFHDIEKRKFNERKAWLLHVQKIEGLKKEVFKKSTNSLNETQLTDREYPETPNASPRETVRVQHHLQKNLRDQARVMESLVTYPNSRLPKLQNKDFVPKLKSKSKKSKHLKLGNNGYQNNNSIESLTTCTLSPKSLGGNNHDDRRSDVPICNHDDRRSDVPICNHDDRRSDVPICNHDDRRSDVPVSN